MTEADAFKYVDWNVMAILVGIWIIAGYFGKSGVPSWLSIRALKLSGVRCKVEHVTDDLPAAAIIAAAKRKKCDVLLIASHDRHGFGTPCWAAKPAGCWPSLR